MVDLKSEDNGKYYKCFRQEDRFSCGVASIRTVNYYLSGKDIGAAVVRHYIDAAEANAPAPIGGRAGAVPDRGVHNFRAAGMSLNDANKALHFLRPARLWEITTGTAQTLAMAQNASANNPMMIGLTVASVLKHFVIAVDTVLVDGEARALVVDPAGKVGHIDEFGLYDMQTRLVGEAVAAIHMRK